MARFSSNETGAGVLSQTPYVGPVLYEPIGTKSQVAVAGCFLVGLAAPFYIRAGGLLYFSDLIFTFVAIYAVLSKLKSPKFWVKPLRVLLFTLGLTLLSYLATDLIKGTPYDNMLRGLGRTLFLGISILGLFFIVRNHASRLCAYVGGFAIGQAACFAILGSPNVGNTDNWKFGYATPVTLIVVLAAGRLYRRSLLLAVGALGSLIVINLFFDFRNAALSLTAVAIALIYRKGRAANLKSLRGPLLLTVAIGIAGFYAFTYASTSGEYSRRRTGSNVARYVGLINSLHSIAKQPILGRGSWMSDAENDVNYKTLYWKLTGKRFYGVIGESQDFGAHSQILSAWYEGGILAPIFFGVLFWQAVQLLLYARKRPIDAIYPLAIYVLVDGLWNILLSPFSGEHRHQLTTFVIMVVLLATEKQLSKMMNERKTTAYAFGTQTWQRYRRGSNSPISTTR